jgi:hypothetical protein
VPGVAAAEVLTSTAPPPPSKPLGHEQQRQQKQLRNRQKASVEWGLVDDDGDGAGGDGKQLFVYHYFAPPSRGVPWLCPELDAAGQEGALGMGGLMLLSEEQVLADGEVREQSIG